MPIFNGPAHPRGFGGKFSTKSSPGGNKGGPAKPALAGANKPPATSHKFPKLDTIKRGQRKGG